jgi:hypothetical protein
VAVADKARLEPERGTWAERRVELLVGLALLLIAGPMMHGWSAAPASRYLLTVAIVEDGTIYLDDYEQHLFLDQAVVDGRVLSDKAPYQALAAVPLFAVYRLAGGEPLPDRAAEHPIDPGPMPGLWWLTLWASTLPAFALFVLMRRLTMRVYPDVAMPVATALLFGTIVLPFAAVYFGHVLSAALVFGAWSLLRDTDRPRQLLLGGVLVALAVGTEYPVAVCAAVLFVDALVRHRWKAIHVAIGGFLGAVPLMAYQWAAFGGPLKTAYQGHLPYFQGDGALGVYNLQPPDPNEIARALIGDRGLFVLTPVLLVALIGAVVAIRQRTPVRRDAIVALAMLVGLVIVSTGVDGIGGGAPGPRYLLPVIPFMALPLAEAWRRFGGVAAAAAVIGGSFMLLATITNPLVWTSERVGPTRWIDAVLDGDLGPNLPRFLGAGWLLPLLVAGGVLVLVVALREERRLRV